MNSLKFFLYALSSVSHVGAASAVSPITAMEMKSIDKVELHLHLGGSWPLAYLKEVAEPAQCVQLTHLLDQIEQGVEYKNAFKVFDLLSKMVNTDKKVEDGVAALCKELAEDGVVYAEIRTGLKDLGSGHEGYLKAVLRGIERGCYQTRLQATVLLSLRRDTPAQVALQTVDLISKYCQQGVTGLDISGISVQGDGSSIVPAIKRAQELDIPITLHIGESPEEAAVQQMKELEMIRPARVGHCVHLCPEAKNWIEMRKIPIELCLTSALKVMMISELHEHPALKLLKQGHPVIICTDDPLIFRTSLSHECAQVAQIGGLTMNTMIRLQEKAYSYRFT